METTIFVVAASATATDTIAGATTAVAFAAAASTPGLSTAKRKKLHFPHVLSTKGRSLVYVATNLLAMEGGHQESLD